LTHYWGGNYKYSQELKRRVLLLCSLVAFTPNYHTKFNSFNCAKQNHSSLRERLSIPQREDVVLRYKDEVSGPSPDLADDNDLDKALVTYNELTISWSISDHISLLGMSAKGETEEDLEFTFKLELGPIIHYSIVVAQL
jgi:hypothetical protein